MGWWHAARPPEPAGPDGWRHAGPNRGVLTRAARRDGSPELTVMLTPRNKGPTRRGQGASPGPIRTPLPNGHRNLLSRCCDDHLSPGCASRSGWLLPSLVLQLAWRLNFCCFSSSPTTVWLIRWPRAASSPASRRRLLQVQRSGDIGSPRSLGATSASRSSSRAASVATSGFRPPPGQRTRSASSRAAVASSFKPRPIVLTAMPVARDTAAIPPYPAVRASVAANSRRLRSSRWGNSKVKRARMPVGSIIPTRYGITPLPRIQPSAPIHLFSDNHLHGHPVLRRCAVLLLSHARRTGRSLRRAGR